MIYNPNLLTLITLQSFIFDQYYYVWSWIQDRFEVKTAEVESQILKTQKVFNISQPLPEDNINLLCCILTMAMAMELSLILLTGKICAVVFPADDANNKNSFFCQNIFN